MSYVIIFMGGFIVGGLHGAAMMAIANAASKNIEEVDARRQQRNERR